jgi:hypothetical protein
MALRDLTFLPRNRCLFHNWSALTLILLLDLYLHLLTLFGIPYQ